MARRTTRAEPVPKRKAAAKPVATTRAKAEARRKETAARDARSEAATKQREKQLQDRTRPRNPRHPDSLEGGGEARCESVLVPTHCKTNV